jgi:hypothetical protein
MGVILWHQIKLSSLGVTASNDPWSGDYIAEAQVDVRYAIGRVGTFEVTLFNLPTSVLDRLGSEIKKKPVDPDLPPSIPIEIRIGYFEDTRPSPVLVGLVESVTGSVEGKTSSVTLKGREKAGFHVCHKRSTLGEGAAATLEVLVRALAKEAGLNVSGDVTPTSVTRKPLATSGQTVITALDRLADAMDAEVLVHEGVVQFGQAVTFPPRMPLKLPGIVATTMLGDDAIVAGSLANRSRLVRIDPIQISGKPAPRSLNDKPKGSAVDSFRFTALGLATMRAGNRVAVTTRGFGDSSSAFRIVDVWHHYSTQSDGGYTCVGTAVQFNEQSGNRHWTQAARRTTGRAVAERLMASARRDRDTNPSIEIGEITSSVPAKRQVTFRYGQDRKPAQSSPSVEAPIASGNPELKDKPLASPFAWHSVGLVVPVYEGMRAVLAQNHDVREDAIVGGFLWSTDPQMTPPDAQQGDWWLCLPTKVSGGKPQGKTANDLVAADGLRVIESPGLLLKIGDGKLTSLGTRPKLGNPDEFVIDHSGNTTITVAKNGEVTIEAKDSPITLKCGSTELKVAKGKVSVSGGNVEIS